MPKPQVLYQICGTLKCSLNITSLADIALLENDAWIDTVDLASWAK